MQTDIQWIPIVGRGLRKKCKKNESMVRSDAFGDDFKIRFTDSFRGIGGRQQRIAGNLGKPNCNRQNKLSKNPGKGLKTVNFKITLKFLKLI